MNVLVTVASKHGATWQIAETLAGALRDAGLAADVRGPDDVTSLAGYDAVILGGAVYMGHWPAPAREFAARHRETLAAMPVWLFSSGPVGDPPAPEGDAPEMVELAARIGARGYQTFGGRIERARLGVMERAIVGALRAPEGDFRDTEAIRGWATALAAKLHQAEVAA
jgi:menaquinone-dependent protoporphyrinogen oxidase